MQPGPLFVGANPLRLGERLGRGGEGEVFALSDDPTRAAKLYTGERAAERAEKLGAMVGSALAAGAPDVAFPEALITDARGGPLGFLMARIGDAHPMHDLYAPGPRKRVFPHANYAFLVRVAANAARAVAQAHAAGCVIGDINHSGFLVADDATLVLIDADSFAFDANGKHFPCAVGVPEYTAPELQGQNLRDVTRTAQHDAFALAVIIFQLLVMGRHPFAGIPVAGDLTIPEAIRAGALAYASNPMLAPPDNTLRLSDMPADVARAFEAAFASRTPGPRPSPAHWVDVLERAEKALIVCPKVDAHRYWTPGLCPWCAIETATGAPLFRTALAGSAPSLAAQARFDDAGWGARVAAIPVPALFAYAPPDPAEAELPEFPERPRAVWWKRVSGAGMMGLCAYFIFVLPQAWVMAMPVAIAGFHWFRGPPSPLKAATKDLKENDGKYRIAAERYQWAMPLDALWRRKRDCLKLIVDRAALDRRAESVADEVRARFAERERGKALRRHLTAFSPPVEAHAGLGERLAAAGIGDAYAVLRTDLAANPHLSADEADTLTAWARGVEAEIGAIDGGAAADAAVARAHAKLSDEAHGLEAELAEAFRALAKEGEALARAAEERRADIDAVLVRRRALVAEIEALGGTAAPLEGPRARAVSDSLRLQVQGLERQVGSVSMATPGKQ